jgi:hypothetical protein
MAPNQSFLHIAETDCVAGLEGFEPLGVDFEMVCFQQTKPTLRAFTM